MARHSGLGLTGLRLARQVRAGLLALAGLAAGGAWADVTPEEVWQNWQDSREALGQSVTAEAVERQGDTLIVSGIRLEVAGEGGVTSGLISEIRFRDRGDGSVAVLFPERFPVILSIAPDPDLAVADSREMVLNIAMPGASITASGTPEAIGYVTDAPKVEVVTEVPDGASLVKVAVDLAGVTGKSQMGGTAESRTMAGEYAARALDVTLDVSGEPENEGRFRFSMADLGARANLTGIPPEGAGEDEAALRAGMTVDLSARYGVGSFDLAAKDGGQPFKVSGALGGGTMVISAGADHFAYDGTGKALSLNVSGSDGVTGKPMSFSATLADTTARVMIEGTDWMAPVDFEAALAAGMKMSGGFGIGPASFDFAGEDALGASRAKASLGGLDTHFALDAKALAYDIAAKAVELAMSSPEIPLPEASVTLTEVELDIAMPMAKTDGPAPFNLLLRVVDLGLGDDLWAMLDGAGMLPHDPATLILDTKGTVTLLEDLSEAGETLEGAPPPALLNSIELSRLLARVAGAEVTGFGGFTFDNEDMTTFPGMPLPTGKLDLNGSGVIGLMDKLVAMGVMTGEEAMGMRMMAGAFARIDPVKDEITSALEFKDGHFYANGLKMQ